MTVAIFHKNILILLANLTATCIETFRWIIFVSEIIFVFGVKYISQSFQHRPTSNLIKYQLSLPVNKMFTRTYSNVATMLDDVGACHFW
jgi:hypothetical protein